MDAASVNADKAQAELKALREQNKRLQKNLDSTLESVERYRKANFRLPTGKKTKTKGDFCRVAIPDTHGCHIDTAAAAAMLADLEYLQPTEVILLGDHLDCGGFLAQHHTMGYVAETEYTYEEDVAAGNEFLDQLQKRLPNATYDYLEGNHERRVEQWCVTSALRSTQDAGFLRRMFGVESVLSLEKRGIPYRSLNRTHDDLPVQGAIKRGKCLFVHGASHAKHAATVHLNLFGANVVFGHIHRMQMDSASPVTTGTIAAYCPGCLCKLQPYYNHGKPTGHSHGYHAQFVRETGGFFPLQIPIINGQSYLAPLIERVA